MASKLPVFTLRTLSGDNLNRCLHLKFSTRSPVFLFVYIFDQSNLSQSLKKPDLIKWIEVRKPQLEWKLECFNKLYDWQVWELKWHYGWVLINRNCRGNRSSQTRYRYKGSAAANVYHKYEGRLVNCFPGIRRVFYLVNIYLARAKPGWVTDNWHVYEALNLELQLKLPGAELSSKKRIH